jgi:phage I-like protein
MVWPGRYRGERGQQRDKPYREALRMELAAAGDNMKELREIAKAHIAKCKEGDLQAIRELADRLDGKPTQMLEHSDGEGRPLRRLVREIVHVTKTREQLDDEDLVVEYSEIKTVNGNGRDHAE